MAASQALSGEHIRRLVAELADHLRGSSVEYRLVIAEVAAQHDLAGNWLNHNARLFTPATLATESCADIFTSSSLTLLGVPLDLLFVMKLYRANPEDVADMIRLWPLAQFIAHIAQEAEESGR